MTSTLNVYYNLPKEIKCYIDELCNPTFFVCGARQLIASLEGQWIVLWLFDNTEIYVVNIHLSRSFKHIYIRGFRNKRTPGDINKQLDIYMNQLTSIEDSIVKMLPEDYSDIMGTTGYHPQTMYQISIKLYQISIKSLLEDMGPLILKYIEDPSTDNVVIECQHDPEYMEKVKDGITNKQYLFLFGSCTFKYYDFKVDKRDGELSHLQGDVNHPF